MTTSLLLLRHASAVASDPAGDAARALTDAGREEAAAVAALVAHLATSPRRVLSSPAQRCLETATIVAARLPAAPPVERRGELALDAALDGAIRLASEVGPCALLVSHQPELLGLAAALLHPAPLGFDLAPAALAGLESADASQWRLTLLVLPRSIHLA